MEIQEAQPSRLLKITLVLVSLISFVAIFVSYTRGIMVAYNDAAAHLNTARRIIDNLTPGMVQIGSVWLPLLHLLEIPFVANDFLWRTGLAGAIVSSISFIGASYYLYKLIHYMSDDEWAAAIGVLAFVTNANLLYLQTTAMFEPLLMLTALGAVYFLSRWARSQMLLDLVAAAFFTMLATLTRYDGWALFMSSSAFVLFTNLVLRRRKKEGILLVYLFLAGFGIFLWFLYNHLIFGDALYFARSEFSAGAQQDILESRGQLPTKHNLQLSFITYSLSTLINIGFVSTGLLIVGFLIYLKDNLLKLVNWAPLVILTPYVFNIVSLFMGQSVIWLPMIPPHFDTYFNARYGLLMLPAVAFFAGYLAHKHVLFKVLVASLAVVQLGLFFTPQWPFTEGTSMITLHDTVSAVNAQTRSASKYLYDHHTGGLILVSSASADAFIFRAGIPLRNFITEGTGYYWKNSLHDPRQHATWVVYFQDKSDRVGLAIKKLPWFEKEYTKLYEDQTYQIWKRNTP